jgi:uncharacterized cupin superfamily protein
VIPNLQPSSVSQEQGDAFWFLNNLEIVKATTASTGGSYSLVYQIAPPGAATPYHLHHEEDEGFYVLDGQASFIADGKKTVVTAGGYIFLPCGIPLRRHHTHHHADSGHAGHRLCWDDDRDGGTCPAKNPSPANSTRHRKVNQAMCKIPDRDPWSSTCLRGEHATCRSRPETPGYALPACWRGC